LARANRTGDRAMIESYITCSDCGKMECSYERALELARHSMSVDEWFDFLEALSRMVNVPGSHE
jgi:hypothetical protein